MLSTNQNRNSLQLVETFLQKELHLAKEKLRFVALVDNLFSILIIIFNLTIVAVSLALVIITYGLFINRAPATENIFLDTKSAFIWSLVSASFIALNLILGIIFQFFKVITKFRYYRKIVREIDHKYIYFLNDKDYSAKKLATDVDNLISEYDKKKELSFLTLFKKYYKREI